MLNVALIVKVLVRAMWDEIERLHPKTKIWETCTPCFDKDDFL